MNILKYPDVWEKNICRACQICFSPLEKHSRRILFWLSPQGSWENQKSRLPRHRLNLYNQPFPLPKVVFLHLVCSFVKLQSSGFTLELLSIYHTFSHHFFSTHNDPLSSSSGIFRLIFEYCVENDAVKKSYQTKFEFIQGGI